MKYFLPVLFLLLALTPATTPESLQTYQIRNPDLGVVYRPPGLSWDDAQWNQVFKDPAPPMGWAILPLGTESCSAITPSWLSKVRAQGLKPGLLLDPFLTEAQIKKTVDCAVPLGITRAVLDEFVSYHRYNLNEPLCQILAQVRSIYEYVKKKYPSFEFGIDDNWHAWMVLLSAGQSDACGAAYPYFHADLTGISVLSKYGVPSQGTCGHPTLAQVQEQLIDLKPTVRDYSKSGTIFVWELNRNWYPGDEEVLQVFRQLKPVFGWTPFLLFGPTTNTPLEENWAYRASGFSNTCPPSNYNWYLPARDYLIRIAEGRGTRLTLNAPASLSPGSSAVVKGRITAGGSGVSGAGVQFQMIPPVGSLQHFTATVTAPSNAHLAFVGARINTKLPNSIPGSAQLLLERAQLFATGSTKNLVINSDFNNGLNGWALWSTAQTKVVTNGSEKSLKVTASRSQFLSLTSFPVLVVPGRSYTVHFDAQIFQEARNNGYFYIVWNDPSAVGSNALYMKFPDRQSLAAAVTGSNGEFAFNWQPALLGQYTLYAFYPGTRTFRPSIASSVVSVN